MGFAVGTCGVGGFVGWRGSCCIIVCSGGSADVGWGMVWPDRRSHGGVADWRSEGASGWGDGWGKDNSAWHWT